VTAGLPRLAVRDMRLCSVCGKYIHEECTGLTVADKKVSVCGKYIHEECIGLTVADKVSVCGKYIHEECIGLIVADKVSVCPFCSYWYFKPSILNLRLFIMFVHIYQELNGPYG
jgi:hypothetical protein